MSSVRYMLICAVLLTASTAAAQPVPLAYKYDVGKRLTYALHVEGIGQITTARPGAATVASSPLTTQFDAEWTIDPIERCNDGAYRVVFQLTHFSHQVDMPHIPASLKLFVRDNMLVFAHNNEETVVGMPAAGAKPAPGSAMAGLHRLAMALFRPIRLKQMPNGRAWIEPSAGQRGLDAFGGAAGLLALQRFPDAPLQPKKSWRAAMPAVVPGIAASTVTAQFTLDKIDPIVANLCRRATISVHAQSTLSNSQQPTFGCDTALRLERLELELDGAFVFSVDEGRMLRQEMNISRFDLTVATLGADRRPAGEIRVHMRLRSQLQLVAPKPRP